MKKEKPNPIKRCSCSYTLKGLMDAYRDYGVTGCLKCEWKGLYTKRDGHVCTWKNDCSGCAKMRERRAKVKEKDKQIKMERLRG